MEQNTSNNLSQRHISMSLLVEAAIAVYEEKGMEAASIREITGKAGLADGILNKWFTNKERLGAYVISILHRHVYKAIDEALSFENDPILYWLTARYALHVYLIEKWGYKKFYAEALKRDLFMNYQMKEPDPKAVQLIRHYKPDADKEKITLYSEIMPYMLGRTIVLKKQEGTFQNIPYESIPILMCNEALHYFVSEEEIRGKAPEALRIARKLGDRIPHWPSKELIEATVVELEESGV